MISWKLTVKKILSFFWDYYVSSTRSSWFTGDKQETLTLFFCVVKPLYEQCFDWNCCVDIGSEGKIWKWVQNNLLTAFFFRKMKKNHLKTWNIPFVLQTVDIFRPFSSTWEECFNLKKHGTYMCFQENHKNLFIFGENARNKYFRSKYQQFPANFGQIFAFPTPRH